MVAKQTATAAFHSLSRPPSFIQNASLSALEPMKLKKKTAAYHRGVEDAVCVPQRRSHSQGIEIKKESEERESFFSAGRYDEK